jgi:hypothetical protein
MADNEYQYMYDIFSLTIQRIGTSIVFAQALASVWLHFCVQVNISKSTEGNGLKIHTHI